MDTYTFTVYYIPNFNGKDTTKNMNCELHFYVDWRGYEGHYIKVPFKEILFTWQPYLQHLRAAHPRPSPI